MNSLSETDSLDSINVKSENCFFSLDQAVELLKRIDDESSLFEVDAAYGAFLCEATRTSRCLLDNSTIEDTRKIVSCVAERLEKLWANQIIRADNPIEEFLFFSHLDYYSSLINREVELLKQSGFELSSSSKICIIGSGAMPMTAFELLKKWNLQVTHVDISSHALMLCSQLCELLGFNCKYICGDGASSHFDEMYDLFIIACLAGSNISQKREIVENILPVLKEEGRLLVRGDQELICPLCPLTKSHNFPGTTLVEKDISQRDSSNLIFVYKKN